MTNHPQFYITGNADVAPLYQRPEILKWRERFFNSLPASPFDTWRSNRFSQEPINVLRNRVQSLPIIKTTFHW